MQREEERIKKRLLILFCTVGLGLVFFFLVPNRFWYPFQRGLVVITTPFENIFSWMAFELRDGGAFLSSLGELKTENERLHREVLSLQGNKTQLLALEKENQALREQVGLETHPTYTYLASEVIAQSGDGLSTTLRINRGTKHGVVVGMPVVTAGNVLVGRIHQVSIFSAEVRLLSHHESLIAATTDTVSDQMIVRGDHGLGLLLDLARPTASLESGTQVMTAGLNDGLPAGLLIGTVQTVRPSPDQLFQQAVIIPPVRADQLRFLSILMKF